MSKYSTVNVRKREVKNPDGSFFFVLYCIDTADYLPEYAHFINSLINQGQPANTIRAKAQDLARFYDYFIEAGHVLYERTINSSYSDSFTSPLAQIFEAFPSYLIAGSESQNYLAAECGKRLQSDNIKPSSASRILSTVRDYVAASARVTASLTQQNKETFNVDTISPFGNELLSRVKVSDNQRKKIISRSFLAGCISGGPRYTTARFFKVPKIAQTTICIETTKAFPIRYACEFVQNFKSMRDKAMYALMFGGGLRQHEAFQTKTSDIDFENEVVTLSTPEAAEYMIASSGLRSKGVEHPVVTLIEPFKSFFFDAASAYWTSERQESCSDYFFLKSRRYGDVPYFKTKSQSVIDAFKANLKRCGLEHLTHLTPHSARHFYGYYMHNFCPVMDKDGNIIQYGYSLEEVRKFMRHKSSSSTEVYAIKDIDILKDKVEITNQLLNGKHYDISKIKELTRNEEILNIIRGQE